MDPGPAGLVLRTRWQRLHILRVPLLRHKVAAIGLLYLNDGEGDIVESALALLKLVFCAPAIPFKIRRPR